MKGAQSALRRRGFNTADLILEKVQYKPDAPIAGDEVILGHG